jgi:hypothetical protein
MGKTKFEIVLIKKTIDQNPFTGDEIAFRSIDFRYCPDKCQLCGIKAELRPYGPDGKWVCYDCGMLDEDNAKQIFSTILND